MPQRIRADAAGRTVTTPRCCTRVIATLLIDRSGKFPISIAWSQRRVRRHRRRGRSTVFAVRKVEAVELVACHVFNMADRDDRSISMEMVRTRLDRLREHPPRCCQLCATAAKVAPTDDDVLASGYEACAALDRYPTPTRCRATRAFYPSGNTVDGAAQNKAGIRSTCPCAKAATPNKLYLCGFGSTLRY